MKNAPDVDRALDAGIAALALHPRTRAGYWARRIDLIAALKRAVRIPVIANGALVADAERVLDTPERTR
jgi:tRNA-dihydrouridine synthase